MRPIQKGTIFAAAGLLLAASAALFAGGTLSLAAQRRTIRAGRSIW